MQRRNFFKMLGAAVLAPVVGKLLPPYSGGNDPKPKLWFIENIPGQGSWGEGVLYVGDKPGMFRTLSEACEFSRAGDTIYISGSFTSDNLVEWNSMTWHALGSGYEPAQVD